MRGKLVTEQLNFLLHKNDAPFELQVIAEKPSGLAAIRNAEVMLQTRSNRVDLFVCGIRFYVHFKSLPLSFFHCQSCL
jgi:hypothetical protein